MQRGELDPPRAILEAVRQLGRHLLGQTGLPRPTGSVDRDELVRLDQRGHGRDVGLSADEGRQVHRQVVGDGVQ